MVFGSCRDNYPLDADEFQFLFPCALHFQAQRDGFTYTFGDLVEGACLRVAGGNLGNRGYVKAF